MRALGLNWMVWRYSYAPLMRSGRARPRSVFSADMTTGDQVNNRGFSETRV